MIEFYTTVLITRTRPVVQTTPDTAQPRPPRSFGPATVVELQHAGKSDRRSVAEDYEADTGSRLAPPEAGRESSGTDQHALKHRRRRFGPTTPTC